MNKLRVWVLTLELKYLCFKLGIVILRRKYLLRKKNELKRKLGL